MIYRCFSFSSFLGLSILLRPVLLLRILLLELLLHLRLRQLRTVRREREKGGFWLSETKSGSDSVASSALSEIVTHLLVLGNQVLKRRIRG